MNPALTNNFTTALERAKAIADKLRAKKRELEEEEKQLTPAEKKQKKESTVVKYKPVLKSIDMDIASHMAALVVGRNGEQLRNLETSCNVRITITDEPIEDQRTVTISGEELSVAEARNRIDDIVNGSGSLALLMGGQAPTGHQTIYVQVPTSRVGLVIGRGGETIRSLQEKTGAKVNVCKDGEMDNPPDTKTVVVNGPPHCIAAAQQLIDEIVSGKVYGVPFGVIGISEIIHVPKDKVGLVIGKGGETIQIIQNLCNVKLNIDANSDKNEQRPVTISGTPECIQSAKEQIYERVFGNKKGIPGEGQELGELFNAEYAASDPAYSAAYGTGVPPAYKQKVDQAALLGYDPQTYQAYVEYYAQYYASLGYGEDFGDDNGINGS